MEYLSWDMVQNLMKIEYTIVVLGFLAVLFCIMYFFEVLEWFVLNEKYSKVTGFLEESGQLDKFDKWDKAKKALVLRKKLDLKLTRELLKK